MSKRKLTAYLLEYSGIITLNGDPRPFHEMTIYYLDSLRKRVYSEWLMSHLDKTHDPTPSYLLSTGQRSIKANERKYHTDAAKMGFFTDIETLVTKLGEL